MNNYLPSGVTRWKQIQWLDMTDEHFIVWMRGSGDANFAKLWGRIEDDLEPGKYYVRIANNYNMQQMNGDKRFLLTTVNALGGNNVRLAYAFIAVGVITGLAGFVAFTLSIREKQKYVSFEM